MFADLILQCTYVVYLSGIAAPIWFPLCRKFRFWIMDCWLQVPTVMCVCHDFCVYFGCVLEVSVVVVFLFLCVNIHVHVHPCSVYV